MIINKLVFCVLIIAALVFIFIKNKHSILIKILSALTLFVWLGSIVIDGYYRINYLSYELGEIEGIYTLLKMLDQLKGVLFISIGIVLLCKHYIKKKDNSDAKVENNMADTQ